MTNEFELPKISKNKIDELLQKKPLENLNLIKEIEEKLKKIRGYDFEMPKKNDNVILLLSGGLDTTTIWDILMKKFNLNVYPIFIRRGQIRMTIEEEAVDFFSRYYQKKFPKLFHLPKKLTTFIPPLEIRWDITKFGSIIVNDKLECRGIPMYGSFLANYAVQYGYYLEITQGIKARTVFCGYVKDDGIHMRYETLTSLRTNTENIINITGDDSWQFTSLPIEKKLGYHFGKETIAEYADFYRIPIENSFSCIKYSYYHCGRCFYCARRKDLFKKLKIKDKTIYLDGKSLIFNIFSRVKLILSVFRFMNSIIYDLYANFIYFLKSRW